LLARQRRLAFGILTVQHTPDEQRWIGQRRLTERQPPRARRRRVAKRFGQAAQGVRHVFQLAPRAAPTEAPECRPALGDLGGDRLTRSLAVVDAPWFGDVQRAGRGSRTEAYVEGGDDII